MIMPMIRVPPLPPPNEMNEEQWKEYCRKYIVTEIPESEKGTKDSFERNGKWNVRF
jgi:hypothetical protein